MADKSMSLMEKESALETWDPFREFRAPALFGGLFAMARGALKPGGTVVEGTAGNTGIGLAMVGNALGLKSVIVIPDTQSQEKKDALRLLGAQLIEVPAVPYKDPNNYVKLSGRLAEQLAKNEPGGAVWANQFDNVANRNAHIETTGPEIWEDTGGNVDAFVAGIGTGGTITGVSRFIKLEKKKQILSVGVEPHGSSVISQTLAGKPLEPGPHGIQGIGAGFIPGTLDLNMVDRMERVSDDEAIEMARRVSKEEGVLCGISCGAAVAAAVRVAKTPEMKGKTIVVILPDSGERYLSSVLFDGIAE